jgi:hypothetical protein
MSVYVGIDVHRKRSQVAVVTEDGTVQLNKNVVNGSEPMLRLIGDLPAGTPVAFEAAFGWGWLVELLEDYGFDPHLVHPLRCKAIASARLKNDKVDAAILAQLLRADLLPEAWSFSSRATTGRNRCAARWCREDHAYCARGTLRAGGNCRQCRAGWPSLPTSAIPGSHWPICRVTRRSWSAARPTWPGQSRLERS